MGVTKQDKTGRNWGKFVRFDSGRGATASLSRKKYGDGREEASDGIFFRDRMGRDAAWAVSAPTTAWGVIPDGLCNLGNHW